MKKWSLKPVLAKLRVIFTREGLKNQKNIFVRRVKEAVMIGYFFLMILSVLINMTWRFIKKIPILGRITFVEKVFGRIKFFHRFKGFLDRMDQTRPGMVRRSYLIRLALENIKVKRTRSLVTIGGMAVGIGAIVFLVSLGYGLEKLVIKRVAGLDELKMVDVSLGGSTGLAISSETIAKVKEFSHVKEVLPMVSIVGKVSIQDSVSEVIVYAVDRLYLDLIRLKKVNGELFAEAPWELADSAEGQVSGAQEAVVEARLGEPVGDLVFFNIRAGKDVMVWEDCTINSKILGYTRRAEGGFSGREYWGSEYYSVDKSGESGYDREANTYLGRWVKAQVPLFEKNSENKLVRMLGTNNRLQFSRGCLMAEYLEIGKDWSFRDGDVLGVSSGQYRQVLSTTSESTDSARIAELLSGLDPNSTGSGQLAWVDLEATEAAKQPEQMVLEWKEPPKKEAYVSSGMLRILNLTADNAVGSVFKVSLVMVKSLMPELEEKILSEEVEYKIVGVYEDDANSNFYIPFADMKTLGVTRYSQLKVLAENENTVSDIRKNIETLGFQTTSTADTVTEITKIFRTIRMLLASLGLIALAVAALGIFNTLTVSLLERTREVGVMKAIGMKSDDVRQLFLAEAMVIGTAGGFFGLLFGILFGKGVSFLVSILSILNKQGYLDLTSTPWFFSLFIFFFAFAIGVITGIYPARRATRISALNALRYE